MIPAQFITPESVQDGVLKVNEEEYELIILPPASYMPDG